MTEIGQLLATAEAVAVGKRAGTRIYAAGIDLVDPARLSLALRRCGPPLVRRLFDASERAACADGTDLAAACALFGIKESVVKLVGGMPSGASYRDIAVRPRAGGGALVELAGPFAGWARERGIAMRAGSHRCGRAGTVAWAIAGWS